LYALRALLLASVFLGFTLVWLAWAVVPPWLLYSLVTGLALYVVAAALALRGVSAGYWLGLALAFAVLAVSLPAPAHLAFVARGMLMESAVFLLGSAAQLLYIAPLPQVYSSTKTTFSTPVTASFNSFAKALLAT
jgi:hypothetical protein